VFFSCSIQCFSVYFYFSCFVVKHSKNTFAYLCAQTETKYKILSMKFQTSSLHFSILLVGGGDAQFAAICVYSAATPIAVDNFFDMQFIIYIRQMLHTLLPNCEHHNMHNKLEIDWVFVCNECRAHRHKSIIHYSYGLICSSRKNV
jgi:hypothetical protein